MHVLFCFRTFFCSNFRYRGYYEPPFLVVNGTQMRNPNAYEFSQSHWHIIAGKLFFVIAFEVSSNTVYTLKKYWFSKEIELLFVNSFFPKFSLINYVKPKIVLKTSKMYVPSVTVTYRILACLLILQNKLLKRLFDILL